SYSPRRYLHSSPTRRSSDLSMSSGPNNPWGGFPLFMFASLDASYSEHPEGQYDIGQSPGRGRYGTLRVVDSGHTIAQRAIPAPRSEEHTSELQSRENLVCRL